MPHEHERDDFVYASCLIRARVDRRVLSPVFLREFLRTGDGRKQLRERAKTSAGQFNINIEGLGALRIPLPSIEDQRQSVERLTLAEALRTTYDGALARGEALFKSLQHRAFRDEL